MKGYFSIVILATICGCSVAGRREQVESISPAAGAVGEWVSLKEGERADSYALIDGKIYCGEVACGVDPIDGVDESTFQVNLRSEYARDKSNVYYPLQITCVDGEDCGVCYCVKSVVEGANPGNFRYLGKDYAKDDASVYFRGWLLEGADAKTFSVLQGGKAFYFAVDRNHVFLRGSIFEQADATTFYYDSLHAGNIKGEWIYAYVVRDKNHIWKFTPPDALEELEKD